MEKDKNMGKQAFAKSILTAFIAPIFLLASCGVMPASGPSQEEIVSGATTRGGNSQIIYVTPQIARATQYRPRSGFSADFINAGPIASDTIRAGDILSVRIWENVDEGLLASLGSKVTELPRLQVGQSGTIFVPYVGTVTAAGKTPEQLRRELTNRLAPQTPDPQVEVVREAGDGATVSIINDAGGGGVFPLTQANQTLTSMIASAGGVANDAGAVTVKVVRGGRTSSVRLEDLYDNPSYDIALRPNDRIILETDRRFYTIMGAANAQALVPFPRATVTAIDALAAAGGLNAGLSDPSGIFIFRNESPEVRAKLGQAGLRGAQLVYVLDLTSPDGLLSAREFYIKANDTIYVTEAPFVTWTKTISALTSSINTASGLATAATAF